MSPLKILRSGGDVSDEAFDAIYPDWVQSLSTMFWTPVVVAVHAAQLLVTAPNQNVLDVGSGCGKFCMIGASVTSACFHGIEQRSDLVNVSTLVAGDQNLPNTNFSCGNMIDQCWDDFQGIYLYNPFHEQTSGPWVQIDDQVKYSQKTQTQYVHDVEQKLSQLQSGTRVATYFGFGGAFPPGFSKIAYEQYDQGPLEVWIRD